MCKNYPAIIALKFITVILPVNEKMLHTHRPPRPHLFSLSFLTLRVCSPGWIMGQRVSPLKFNQVFANSCAPLIKPLEWLLGFPNQQAKHNKTPWVPCIPTSGNGITLVEMAKTKVGLIPDAFFSHILQILLVTTSHHSYTLHLLTLLFLL